MSEFLYTDLDPSTTKEQGRIRPLRMTNPTEMQIALGKSLDDRHPVRSLRAAELIVALAEGAHGDWGLDLADAESAVTFAKAQQGRLTPGRGRNKELSLERRKLQAEQTFVDLNRRIEHARRYSAGEPFVDRASRVAFQAKQVEFYSDYMDILTRHIGITGSDEAGLMFELLAVSLLNRAYIQRGMAAEAFVSTEVEDGPLFNGTKRAYNRNMSYDAVVIGRDSIDMIQFALRRGSGKTRVGVPFVVAEEVFSGIDSHEFNHPGDMRHLMNLVYNEAAYREYDEDMNVLEPDHRETLDLLSTNIFNLYEAFYD